MDEKKIKIMYVLTGLHTGGAEVLLRDLLRKLDREKFEPVVVSIVPIGKIGEEIAESGDKVISLNIKRKWNFPAILSTFLKTVKKEDPDIIHSQLFHASFLSRLIKIFRPQHKVISTIHSENMGGRHREVLLRLTDRWSDITNAISQKVAQKMINKKVVPKDRIFTIYNGVDTNKFHSDPEKGKEIKKKLNIENRNPVLISVGRLTPAKGFPYLIKSVEMLKQKYPDIVLLILGEGEERSKLEKQIKQTELEDNVFLLGNKSNVIDYLNASDIFVSSSLWEGLPTAILEAMACELLVVATNVGGTGEIIEDGIPGFLVESKNVQALSNKIAQLLNSHRKEKMGEQGKKIVKEKFSLDKMVDNYQKLYLDLCRNKKK